MECQRVVKVEAPPTIDGLDEARTNKPDLTRTIIPGRLPDGLRTKAFLSHQTADVSRTRIQNEERKAFEVR